jgi:hypothetical protein
MLAPERALGAHVVPRCWHLQVSLFSCGNKVLAWRGIQGGGFGATLTAILPLEGSAPSPEGTLTHATANLCVLPFAARGFRDG